MIPADAVHQLRSLKTLLARPEIFEGVPFLLIE